MPPFQSTCQNQYRLNQPHILNQQNLYNKPNYSDQYFQPNQYGHPNQPGEYNEPTKDYSHPSRPPKAQISAPGPDSSNFYSNNSSLPFEYPKGYFCKKCKNTGFKDNLKRCKPCWGKFLKTVYNPNPELGLSYPCGFICEKCSNTGIKRENGHSCTHCFERYGPRNRVQAIPGGYGSQNIMVAGPAAGMGPMMGMNGPPVQLMPGDPKLGGILCGRCKGSGQVAFFLDTEICPMCGGIGRIVNVGIPHRKY